METVSDEAPTSAQEGSEGVYRGAGAREPAARVRQARQEGGQEGARRAFAAHLAATHRVPCARAQIDPEELSEYLRFLGYKCKKAEVDDMIWEVDEDCDHCVNWEEFKTMCARPQH